MEIASVTKSICPVCRMILPATIYYEDDKTFIKKTCPEHGAFKSTYFSDKRILHSVISKIYEADREISFFDNKRLVSPPSSGLFSDYPYTETSNSNPFKTDKLGAYLTAKCNLNCSFCFQGERNGFIDEFNLNDFKKIVELYPHVKQIRIDGSEVTVRQDLFDIISFLKSKNKSCIIATNGILTSVDKYVKKLKEVGLDFIHLSFEVTPEAYLKLRGVDLSKNVKKSIENFKKYDIPFGISVTISEENFDKLKDAVEFSMKNNACAIRISPVVKSVRNPVATTGISPGDIILKFCDDFNINLKELEQAIKYRYFSEKVYELLRYGDFKRVLCHTFFWFIKKGENYVKITDTFGFKLNLFILKILSNPIFETPLKLLGKIGLVQDILDLLYEKSFQRSNKILRVFLLSYMNRGNVDLRYLMDCNVVNIIKKSHLENPTSFCYYWLIGDKEFDETHEKMLKQYLRMWHGSENLKKDS